MRKFYRRAEPVLLLLLLALYLIVLLKITVFRGEINARSVSIIPLRTILEYMSFISHGRFVIGLSNLFGNLIIFAPLGYLLAALFPNMRRFGVIFLLSLCLSLLIEAAQFILACGASDIDDLILNTLGGLTGYFFYALLAKILRTDRSSPVIVLFMTAAICLCLLKPGSYNYAIIGDVTVSDGANMNVGVSPEPQETEAADDGWYLILVNRWNPVPDDYKTELLELANGQLVDTRIYPALAEMLDAATADGFYPVVASGYRSAERQQKLLDDKIAELSAAGLSAEAAKAKAETWVALPGTSEHQLGIAVDINADGVYSAGYEVYGWLEENAHKYGFINRYPPDKADITGVTGEPWHYRYVGIPAAAEIYGSGLCFEEYLSGTAPVAPSAPGEMKRDLKFD